MDKLTALERAVLDKLLSGDSPVLSALRRQAELATVRDRRLTGVGFMTSLALPIAVPRAPVKSGMLRFGDVEAQMDGLLHGAGFALYVKDGSLDAIEGYTYDEPWPQLINKFTLRYMDEGKRDYGELDV
jgi:hypothetical protein